MKALLLRYYVFFPFIIGVLTIFRLPGVLYTARLFAFISIAIIVFNLRLVLRDEKSILKCSFLYLIVMISSQLSTPVLNGYYGGYENILYYIFALVGIGFWILGYKGYELFHKSNVRIIKYVVFVSLVASIGLIVMNGGMANMDATSELYNYIYQVIPYTLLWMTASLFLFKKGERMVVVLLFLILVVLSTKRGPLVSMLSGFFCIGVLYYKDKLNLRNILMLLSGFLVLYVVFFVVLRSFTDLWMERWTDAEEKGSLTNGRELIRSVLMAKIASQDLIQTIVGNGNQATVLITYKFFLKGINAHDDFLDILYNQGIIGLAAFVSMIVSWIRYVNLAIKTKYEYAYWMAYLLICFIIGSSVSSNLVRMSTCFFSMFFYYFAGRLSNLRLSNLRNC